MLTIIRIICNTQDDINNDRLYYHVTHTSNLDSILTNGLIPKIGERSLKIPEIEAKVYMFDHISSMEDAIDNWLLEELGEDSEITALEIRVPDHIEVVDNFSERTCTQVINPEYIRILWQE